MRPPWFLAPAGPQSEVSQPVEGGVGQARKRGWRVECRAGGHGPGFGAKGFRPAGGVGKGLGFTRAKWPHQPSPPRRGGRLRHRLPNSQMVAGKPRVGGAAARGLVGDSVRCRGRWHQHICGHMPAGCSFSDIYSPREARKPRPQPRNNPPSGPQKADLEGGVRVPASGSGKAPGAAPPTPVLAAESRAEEGLRRSVHQVPPKSGSPTSCSLRPLGVSTQAGVRLQLLLHHPSPQCPLLCLHSRGFKCHLGAHSVRPHPHPLSPPRGLVQTSYHAPNLTSPTPTSEP